MIDIEKTISLRGYDPLMLSYGSGKKVWSICNICGNGRWLNFQSYSDLCHKCAKNVPEAKEAVSIQFKEYYSDPEHRKAKSDQMIQYYTDHPEARDEISKTLIKYLEDHPDAVDAFTERMKVYWADQSHRDERSIISTKYQKDHPEFSLEHSEFMVRYWSIQSNRDDQSDRLKNSEAMEIAIENMIGGDDVVEHHYLYDHFDLLKNTVKMARSDHSRLHWLLWRLGVEVPHINQ